MSQQVDWKHSKIILAKFFETQPLLYLKATLFESYLLHLLSPPRSHPGQILSRWVKIKEKQHLHQTNSAIILLLPGMNFSVENVLIGVAPLLSPYSTQFCIVCKCSSQNKYCILIFTVNCCTLHSISLHKVQLSGSTCDTQSAIFYNPDPSINHI